MLTFQQYLTERFITTQDSSAKEKHLPDLIDHYKKSYSNLDGGYGGHGAGTDREHHAIVSDIMNPHHIVKIHKKDGKVLSSTIYKKQHGRKMIAASTNGTTEGKHSLMGVLSDDHTQKRAWGELSGALAHVAKKHGWPNVHNSQAGSLTGKEILRHDPNGEHYDRLIGGERHTKSIHGHPSFDKKL
jgi:hypothetical protein